MNGADVLVLLDMGTEVSPDYQVIGCQRDSTLEETSDSVDYSCKDSRAQAVDYGRYSSTLSLDALYVASRADFQKLKQANRDGTFLTLLTMVDGEITQKARAKIDSMSQSFPDQAEAVISAAFTLDGVIVSSWVIGSGVLGEAFII